MTMTSNATRLIVAALLTSGLACANAASTRYDFSIDWTQGSLIGTTSTGSLSFDSSLALPNASYKTPNTLLSFELNLRGQTHTLSEVTVGYLAFDSLGDLRMLGVGTDCKPGICYSYSGNEKSFSISYDSSLNNNKFFAYNGDAGGLLAFGSGAFSTTSSVPEANTLLMTAVGLAFGFMALRTRKQA
jgi:hypothetical protein